MNQITYALDYETHYSKECSVKTLGPRGYFSHPDFDAYLVTVVGSDGYEYVGHPRDFDWAMLNGQVVLSHNASFDESLYLFGVEKGWWPACSPAAWHCTADMVAFLGLPRSLKDASKAALGVELSKTTRDNMCGKRWETMSEAFRAEVSRYALDDARYCLALWEKLSPDWPEFERRISATNRKIGQRGLAIDEPLLRRNLEVIKQALFVAESTIPWVKDGEYTPLSRKAFNAECRKNNVEPPVSLAQDSPEADAWFLRHEREFAWARAVQSWRRTNALLRKLESFDNALMADGRFYGGFMYAGANPTLRFSGSGGNLNLQNLPRGELFGVDLRPMIVAGKGKKLIIADLAQIEVRTLFWWAKDLEALRMIRESDDIYHVIAVMLNLHDPANGPLRENKPLRQRVKAMALGCQFGLGKEGFAAYSGVSIAEAEESVNIYRAKMKSVVRFWEELDRDITMCSALGQELKIDMPSGRTMRYGVPRRMKTTTSEGKQRFQYVGKMVRNGQRRDFRLWRGLIAENCIFEQSQVLTDTRGWVAIKDVQLSDKVWDGVEFVAHSGFKASGTQAVINVHGVWATPDHRFLVGEEWLPAERVCTISVDDLCSPRHNVQRLHQYEVWDLPCPTQGRQNQEEGAPHTGGKGNLGASMRLREGCPEISEANAKDSILWPKLPPLSEGRLPQTINPWEEQPPNVSCVGGYEGAMRSPHLQSVAQLRGSWNHGVREVEKQLPEFLDGHAPNLAEGAISRQDRQQSGILPRELPLGHVQAAGTEPKDNQAIPEADGDSPLQWGEAADHLCPPADGVDLRGRPNQANKSLLPVGDLLNCGPRHRFVVRAGEGCPTLTCHNCAQGLARDVFADMMLRVEASKYEVVLQCHDELVAEVDEDKAEEALAEIMQIMSEPPAWIPDLPVAAEGHIASCYSK